jgi:hypothetical protein
MNAASLAKGLQPEAQFQLPEPARGEVADQIVIKPGNPSSDE